MIKMLVNKITSIFTKHFVAFLRSSNIFDKWIYIFKERVNPATLSFSLIFVVCCQPFVGCFTMTNLFNIKHFLSSGVFT